MPDTNGAQVHWDERVEFYIRQSLRELDFTDKTVLDIGAGTGLFSCYMAWHGARRVTAVEPDLDGSSGTSLAVLSSRVQALGLTNVHYSSATLQSYQGPEAEYDVILLHNVINHLDEDAVIVAHEAEWARQRYRELLAKVRRLLTPGGILVIADCARHNVFPLLGLQNPFLPTIEWHKHQNPELWTALLQDTGFMDIRCNWTIPTRLRRIGWLLNNRPTAFLLNSHFVLHANRPLQVLTGT